MIDDDDLLLNIVSKDSKKQVKTDQSSNSHSRLNPNNNQKPSKTDIKKMKYTAKLKGQRSRGKNQQSHFTSFLLNKTQSHVQYEQANERNEKLQDTDDLKKIFRQRNKPRQESQNRKQGKRQYKYSRSLRDTTPGNFNPSSRKDVIISQLLPEAQNQKSYINKNDLSSFNLQQKLKNSLEKSGVQKMTEIQSKSYQSLINSVDSVIKASTGSGKTLAYLIPILNRIIKMKIITKRQDGTCVLIICPTRQLCVQGQKQANRCLKRCPFIISGCLYGGEQTNHQKSRLRKGTNILFCTPGRVLYHLENTQSFKLHKLEAIVFQEADRTLDMGFHDSVLKILKLIEEKTGLQKIHKILVSAHFNSKVSSLLQQLKMKEPSFIGFQNINSQMNIQKLKESKDTEINTSTQLKQQYVLMSQEQKIPLMLAYLSVLKNCKALIFVSTIDEVQFFDYLLTNLKFRDSNGNDTEQRFQSRPVYKIHGDLDQKLRTKTYLQFRQSKQAILISTQVASRGLDFPDLSHIILYDVPPTITDYGNRVGRSARFNQTGVSLLMLHYLQSDYAQKIRYYVPSLQLIQKDLIYESFEKVLKSMNIGDQALHYIQGLVRSSVKYDNQKYMIARKAYTSMLRAYARLPQRQIFAVKKLNLKLLARSFGLNNAQSDHKFYEKSKTSHLQTSRKKRKVEDVKKLQYSQYM